MNYSTSVMGLCPDVLQIRRVAATEYFSLTTVSVLYIESWLLVSIQVFWTQKSSSSTSQVEPSQEFRHVLPARHLSYKIDDLRLNTTYLIQVVSDSIFRFLTYSYV